MNEQTPTKTIELIVPLDLHLLRYPGNRNKIALWWERCGDELTFFDGHMLQCGTLENYYFLQWCRVNGLSMVDMQIGDSDNEAINCLLLDSDTGTISLEDRQETYNALRNEYVEQLR